MKVAVLGSGAREHALAARLVEELGAASVWVSPGGPCIPGSFSCEEASLASVLVERGVSLVLIGPEAMLARGVADQLRQAGLSVLGPGEDDARLETSKAFAKDFMIRHRVARARSETVRGVSVARAMAKASLANGEGGVVLKYDGLAAGKGVFVCEDQTEVDRAADRIAQSWGEGAEVLVEERLRGRELSLVALVANGQARLFPPVEDHKQLHDADRGPMTGGMGAYYPIPGDGEPLRQRLLREIVEPTLRGLRSDHPHYRGALFFGVMVTADGPKLLEYNVRFGDPETQILTAGMGESLSMLCRDAAEGKVAPGWIALRAPAAICVVLAAPGYPEAAELGVAFATPAAAAAAGLDLFYAGAARDAAGRLHTAGGRVLSVVARGESLAAVRRAAYAAIGAGGGLHFRRDIGAREQS